MPIVAGTAAFVFPKKDMANKIEKEMAKAARKARQDGVTDPNEVRELMLAAREKTKKDKD